ncbi:translational activator of GCN4, partial [Cladochytrium tenue]
VEVGEQGVPEALCKKDLAVVVTKLLGTAKADITLSNPLRPSGFAYIFPLLACLIHQRGRALKIKEKIRTELVMHAADLLIMHCSLGGSPLVPRRAMVAALVELVTRYPRLHGAAREALRVFCVGVEDAAATADEDLLLVDPWRREAAAGDPRAIALVLLDALLSSEAVARLACLQALLHLLPPDVPGTAARIWGSRFDVSEDVRGEAERLWEVWYGEDTPPTRADIPFLVKLLTHDVGDVRGSAGRGLSEALAAHPAAVTEVLEAIVAAYKASNAPPVPEYDQYGMVIPETIGRQDAWPARSGLALALKACAAAFAAE